ncbi:MAG: protease [Pirellulaceae bacterium]|nr:MAG: protease [Pirellulaceae bacterium]
MKNFFGKRMCVVAVVFVWAVVPSAIRVLAGEEAASGKAANKIAFITIPAVVAESEGQDELAALFGMGDVVSFRALVERLARARDDNQVAAVVLRADLVGLGPAQIEEVRRLLDEIQQKGKPVYAHVDDLSMEQYVLLSGVSRLSITPTGDVWVTGLYLESPYVRELLDKLGVEPDFMTCGAYKSAAEIFTRSEPSVEAKENREWLADGIFSRYVNLITQGRKVPAERVRQWIDQGLFSAEEARRAGIVDAVEYAEEFLSFLKTTHGENIQLDKRYGRAASKQIDLSSPLGLLQFYAELLGGSKPKTSTKEAVAVIYVEGPIVTGSAGSDPWELLAGSAAYSTPIRRALDEAAQDPLVKAVVLRVDSPGGSVVASETILEATRHVKQNKPIVVSMGNVAGSGGYYVACGVDTIFAEETTITGSIGVVGGKLATRGLWEKLGIEWHAVQRGQHAGMLLSAEKFSPSERDRLRQWMNEVYAGFKERVVAVRGDRLKKEIEDLAGGRVYTGRQALELGLVDKLGGLQDAIQFVASQAGLEQGKYEVRTLPRPRSLLDILLDSEPNEDGRTIRLDRLLGSSQSGLYAEWQALRTWEPGRARLLGQALVLLGLLRSEQVTMSMAPLWVRGGRP